MISDDRHQAVEAARLRADLSVQQLWLRYLALGGSSDAFDIDGYLQDLVPLDTFQQDVLAQAVNEALEDLYRSLQVPLSAANGDGAVDDALPDVIEQMLAHRPDALDPHTPPSGLREHQTRAPDGRSPPSPA
jgi:hypothetical protein